MEISEGSRIKGEVTIVLSPGVSDEQIAGETMKKEGYEKKDLNVNVNMLRVAESLNS